MNDEPGRQDTAPARDPLTYPSTGGLAASVAVIAPIQSIITDLADVANARPEPGEAEARSAVRLAEETAEETAEVAAMIRALPGRPPEVAGHTHAAVEAIVTAVSEEQDFGGWLGSVLCRAAARLGSSEALIAGRPGSWEASLVYQLVAGTDGPDDELLSPYREPPRPPPPRQPPHAPAQGTSPGTGASSSPATPQRH